MTQNTIKLSRYIEVNKPYFLRNIFIDFVNKPNFNLNFEIEKLKDYIRESVYKGELETDINLYLTLEKIGGYIRNNILNYSEIKKVFKISYKDIVSPKTTFKAHLESHLISEYYINNILEAV